MIEIENNKCQYIKLTRFGMYCRHPKNMALIPFKTCNSDNCPLEKFKTVDIETKKEA